MNTWLLPDGINESLPDDAEKLESLRRQLVDLYASWGYRLVMPPLVEYLESLRVGMGTQLDLQTFKITDQLTGRMMGVRADITPQVARMDAHRLSKGDSNAPVNRLCYIGTVLRTRSVQQGGSRSPVQVGAEIFGHEGVESDFEIISLMLETLQSVDVTGSVLDLGHVRVVSGLVENIGLDQQQQDEYFGMLARKSIPEIDRWLENQNLMQAEVEVLSQLPRLNGGIEILQQAREILKDADQSVLDAVDHLGMICQLIESYFPKVKIHIDLSEMRGYAYHTGIIFSVYLSGRGDSIAQGGRYDGIGEAFGNHRPAIGFSTDLRTLASFIEERKTTRKNYILAPYALDKELDELINTLRKEGANVIRQLDKDSGFTAVQYGCSQTIEKHGDAWVVVDL
ncbi:MAG: ATP phosphoribosyltransferase regulatory subunit [Cocleimonas sp.]